MAEEIVDMDVWIAPANKAEDIHLWMDHKLINKAGGNVHWGEKYHVIMKYESASIWYLLETATDVTTGKNFSKVWILAYDGADWKTSPTDPNPQPPTPSANGTLLIGFDDRTYELLSKLVDKL